MGKIGNSTNRRDVSDMTNPAAPSINSGHKGGRRIKTGRKEQALAESRSHAFAAKKGFRSGAVDAREGDATGPVNSLPTAKRRGAGSPMMKPSAGCRD